MRGSENVVHVLLDQMKLNHPKELASESELTPLHLASYSGSENVVRALLNSSGVEVEAKTVPSVSHPCAAQLVGR